MQKNTKTQIKGRRTQPGRLVPAVRQENVCTNASCATPLFSYVIDVNTGCRRMQNARCLPTGATRDDIALQPGATCRE